MDTLEVHVGLADGPEAVKPEPEAAFTGRLPAQSSSTQHRVDTPTRSLPL